MAKANDDVGRDLRNLTLAIGAGAILGGLAVYAIGGSKSPFAILGGAWVGGMVPAAYFALKTDAEGRTQLAQQNANAAAFPVP